MFNNKIFIQNIPVINTFNILRDGFQMTPFFHVNLLWAPEKLSEKSDKYDPFYVSAGFGINLLTEAIAIELNYNAYIRKNSHDIGNEFYINFGID
jgi:hypothetical protein